MSMKPTTFDPVGDDQLSYRALSLLSLVALGLGVASPLALAAPFLLLIPAAAIAATFLALGQIKRSEGRLAGAGAAYFGFALALIAVATTVVRGPVRAALIQRQADAAAQAWAEKVAAGQFDEAAKLMTAGVVGSFAPKREPGTPAPPDEQLRQFFLEGMAADKVIAAIGAAQPPRLTRVGGSGEPLFERGAVRLATRYALGQQTSAAKTPAKQVDIFMLRIPAYELEGSTWRVERWAYAEPAAR